LLCLGVALTTINYAKKFLAPLGVHAHPVHPPGYAYELDTVPKTEQQSYYYYHCHVLSLFHIVMAIAIVALMQFFRQLYRRHVVITLHHIT